MDSGEIEVIADYSLRIIERIASGFSISTDEKPPYPKKRFAWEASWVLSKEFAS